MLAVDDLGELGGRLQAVTGVRLGGDLLGAQSRSLGRLLLRFALLGGLRRLDGRHQLDLGEARVPDVHGVHRRELGQGLVVGGHRRQRHLTLLSLGEAVVARRDGEARGHASDVVLERPGQRLVEVVEVEEQGPLGRCEDAEVGEVRVAAELGHQAGPRRVPEVGGHDPRGAAIEGERRDQHAAVAHGHEVGLAGGVLLLQERDGIGTVRRRLPAGVAGRGDCLSSRLAARRALVNAGMHYLRRLGHGLPTFLPRAVLPLVNDQWCSGEGASSSPLHRASGA